MVDMTAGEFLTRPGDKEVSANDAITGDLAIPERGSVEHVVHVLGELLVFAETLDLSEELSGSIGEVRNGV